MPAVKESVLGRRAAASPPLGDPVPLAKKQQQQPPRPLDIIDIRGGRESSLDLKHEVASMLNPVHGPRRLPTLLLYDEKGLQMFEEVRRLLALAAPSDRAMVLTGEGRGGDRSPIWTSIT